MIVILDVFCGSNCSVSKHRELERLSSIYHETETFVMQRHEVHDQADVQLQR